MSEFIKCKCGEQIQFRMYGNMNELVLERNYHVEINDILYKTIEIKNDQNIKFKEEIETLKIRNDLLISLKEFVQDCSVSHIETRYKYRAKVIMNEIGKG